MAQKLNGRLNLSAIPKGLITKDKNGNSVIYVDIIPNKNGADQYGNTHALTLYDKEARRAIYLGNFKPIDFGKGEETKAGEVKAPVDENNDLPF